MKIISDPYYYTKGQYKKEYNGWKAYQYSKSFLKLAEALQFFP
jgi:hypothetical protein